MWDWRERTEEENLYGRWQNRRLVIMKGAQTALAPRRLPAYTSQVPQRTIEASFSPATKDSNLCR